jgi:hypothetical protein
MFQFCPEHLLICNRLYVHMAVREIRVHVWFNCRTVPLQLSIRDELELTGHFVAQEVHCEWIWRSGHFWIWFTIPNWDHVAIGWEPWPWEGCPTLDAGSVWEAWGSAYATFESVADWDRVTIEWESCPFECYPTSAADSGSV